MNRHIFLWAAAILGELFMAEGASAQTWTKTSAPAYFWKSMALSADGSNIIAASIFSGCVYISTNSGTSWAQTGLPSSGDWVSVACSTNFIKLIAADDGHYGSGGRIYTSTNSGNSWLSNNVPHTNWNAVITSADGAKLVIGASGGTNPPVYTSTDSGQNWRSNNVNIFGRWQAVTTSADGTKLAASSSVNIYTSSNSGTNWTKTSAPLGGWWVALASSSDGVKLAAAENYGYNAVAGRIYTSTNSGTNWGVTTAPATNWTSIASSADGTRLVAAAGGYSGGFIGPIYTSADSGKTWTLCHAPVTNWTAVTCSADGTKMVAASAYSGIYVARSLPPLSIQPLPPCLKFAWNGTLANVVLQSNSNLNTPNWVTLTNVPSFNPATFVNSVILSSSNQNSFYRLARP